MRAELIVVILALVVTPASAGAAAMPPLVAACSGCHAANGGDPMLPRLAGRNAGDIVAAMKAFRTGGRPATVMDRIAKGFTDDEIAAIAAWYAAQR
jgi:cytochrome subunit of sulfide dehydrogenase